jgi:hypothetical protein
MARLTRTGGPVRETGEPEPHYARRWLWPISGDRRREAGRDGDRGKPTKSGPCFGIGARGSSPWMVARSGGAHRWQATGKAGNAGR